jgi:cell wall-associated NlpC family hydrolase
VFLLSNRVAEAVDPVRKRLFRFRVILCCFIVFNILSCQPVKIIVLSLCVFMGGLMAIGAGLTAASGGASSLEALGTVPAGAVPAGTGSSGGVPTAGTASPGSLSWSAVHAVAYAESMVGVPYVWGGSGPSGFDCSGLVWAAYSATPVAFSRMGAADEKSHTAAVAPGQPLHPGDLVFFSDSTGAVQHVGIYVGDDASGVPVMVDAPHAGATVRYDDFSDAMGGAWGDEYFAGATDPSSDVPAY